MGEVRFCWSRWMVGGLIQNDEIGKTFNIYLQTDDDDDNDEK